MRIALEYSLTADDVAEYSAAFSKMQWRRTWPRLLRGPLGFGIILIAAVVIFILFHKTPQDEPASQPAATQPSLGVFGLLPWIVLAIIILLFVFKRRILRHFAGRRLAGTRLGDQLQVVASDEALTVCATTFSNTLQWAHFVRLLETPHLLLLFESEKAAFIVPKRAFHSAEEMSDFCIFARSHIREPS